MELSQHALSAAFPAMRPSEYQALKDNIENIGVLNPITIYQGQVIDGWHRYLAANEVGIPCPSVQLLETDPRDFVLSQNKHRRHVTESQMALATVAVYAWKPLGVNQHDRVDIECPPSKSNAELAEIAGVHVSTVKQAKIIQLKAAPEIREAVKAGAIGLPKATAISKLPREEQAAAISKPLAKIAKNPEVQHPDQVLPEEFCTDLELAQNQIMDLQAALAVANMGSAPDEDKAQAATLITELRTEIKRLQANLATVTLSRDRLQNENAELHRKLNKQRHTAQMPDNNRAGRAA